MDVDFKGHRAGRSEEGSAGAMTAIAVETQQQQHKASNSAVSPTPDAPRHERLNLLLEDGAGPVFVLLALVAAVHGAVAHENHPRHGTAVGGCALQVCLQPLPLRRARRVVVLCAHHGKVHCRREGLKNGHERGAEVRKGRGVAVGYVRREAGPAPR